MIFPGQESALPVHDRDPDENDRATRLEMEANAALVDRARLAARQDQTPGPDGLFSITECVECGEYIGEGRLRAAARNTLCVHCATAAEQMKKRFA